MQKNAIKSFKSRILNKFKSVKEDTNFFSNYLTSCLEQYEKKISETFEADNEQFYSLYKKLNQDLENFHDKIIVLQAEICSEENSSDESGDSFQDSLLELNTNSQASSSCPNKVRVENSLVASSTEGKNFNQTLDLQKAKIDVNLFDEKSGSFLKEKKCDLVKNDGETFYLLENCSSERKSTFSKNEIQFSDPLTGNENLDSENLHSSCYHSLSSVSSDALQVQSNENNSIDNCLEEKSNVSSPVENQTAIKASARDANFSAIRFSELDLSSKHFVTLTCITDPSDFWLQIENSTGCVKFPLSEHISHNPPSKVTKGFFYLAPLKNNSFYYRIQALNNASKDDKVEVFFIDYGPKHEVFVKDIRQLPWHLYDVPTQAYRCSLFGISPLEENWSTRAINRFKEFQYYCIEAEVRCMKDNKYGVQLFARASADLSEDFSSDIGLVLQMEDLALECVEAGVLEKNNSAVHNACENKKHFDLSPGKTLSCNDGISYDSGVSVTSNHRSGNLSRENLSYDSATQANLKANSEESFIPDKKTDYNDCSKAQHNLICERFEEDFLNACKNQLTASQEQLNLYCNNLNWKEVEKACLKKFKVSADHRSANLSQENLSFDSATQANSEESFFPAKKTDYKDCSKVQHDLCERFEEDFLNMGKNQLTASQEQLNLYCNSLNWKVKEKADLKNLKVSAATLSFVKKNNMLVMISSVVSPHDFHVNSAMENCERVDELREQMAFFYEPPSDFKHYYTYLNFEIDEAYENMFCACRYEDDFWYRAKILHINKRQKKLTIQFVDYGNTAVVESSDLRLLAPQFVELPAFSIHCCLAGIVPKGYKNAKNKKFISPEWDDASIKEFKSLITFEKPLTAEICQETSDIHFEPLHILLWDSTSSEDVLINLVLVNKGLAENVDLHKYLLKKDSKQDKNDLEILNEWDPMAKEYNSIENSYGVDCDDIQVATAGYSAKDDEYTCKYFSLRGTCPRKDCPFLHEAVIESDVTRDQEEVYSFDAAPLISKNESDVLMEVLVVKSPFQFYAVLPFGNKTVDEVDAYILQGGSYKELIDKEVNALHLAMSQYYSTAPFNENTKIALAFGSIVAAKSNLDNQWHRGRIIDVQDMCGPAKIFFLDYGNEEWVDRKLIRKMLPQFLYTPFQAVQCIIADIEPINFKKGIFWNEQAIDRFVNLITGSLLLAHIHHRCGNVLYVTLKKTMENDHSSISETLVVEGYAKYISITSQKNETLYMPG